MSYNEAETRYHLIDPALRDKGYDDASKLKLETPAPVEAIGHKGRRRAGGGRTDYLLCVQTPDCPAPLPVGVLEAKKEDADPLKGMQQAKSYAECSRFHVRYVFATNGHLYGEYDKTSGLQSGPHPFKEHFPSHAGLTRRYADDTGIALDRPDAALLFAADSAAYPKKRYYQDAAIRACFEKILRCEQLRQPCRVLLALATGAGKTVLAANLLWRLNEAQGLPKPALFLCDRDELREQAYNKLSAAFGDSARIVANSKGRNAAKNARVHIATYQTLGLDDEDAETASFLSAHYPPDSFSVIIIDECHRSAWGRWSEVLLRNPNAIHIGLTATPRQLRESRTQTAEDAQITANNLKYFGEPVYEYSLIQAQEDGYLAACEIVKRKATIDAKTFTGEEVLKAGPIDARTGLAVGVEQIKAQYIARQFDDELLLPERVAAMCDDLFRQFCLHGGPEQKAIIFCTRDIHADRVVQQMNNLYSLWCKQQGLVAKDHYAFKCTASGGRELIQPMRGSGERAFIACTVDLLATGVDIERLNAVVFFRYLESSILFYQMVGRGARIDEPTQKYKFWLYDYTGVTDLFGTDFITANTSGKSAKPDGGTGGGEGEGGEPPVIQIAGQQVSVASEGRYILSRRDGRDVKIPIDDYRREILQRVLSEARSLHDFRQLWIATQKRRELIDHLLGDNYSPELLRELEEMQDFDYYDMFAHHGYHAQALKRRQRGQAYLDRNLSWFESMPGDSAIVLKGFGRQFGLGGTDALETPALWDVPEIQQAGGLAALKKLGKPAEVIFQAKCRLFGV
ncbi:DEAD/DEAH box helicase family protein [Candidatus Methylospira mobilis]|uniref:DEAD/DEAH box helicase family protein n=1 Tax=Candidatus Methylospira mobilis TaxID=1808979 RepID=UPI0028EB4277|nr:DEAD/DEAH box helicase family protein [Candidatus Methylospira mobilis]WNV06035.1 DEAD/DEAH box helicase family protein [Candidatus Methylospira mobilis]